MARTDLDRRGILRNLLIVVIGQVGCLTLLVVLLLVALGLWLDASLGTRPIFTLVLLAAGVPLSVLLMLVVARRTLARFIFESKSEHLEGL